MNYVLKCGLTAVALAAGLDVLATPLGLGFDATTVVTGREASVGFALHELNEIVAKSAGRGFEVGQRAWAAKERRIFLGRSEEAEKILGADFWKDLKSQESLVFAKGNDLFIQGGDELGLLWAVYDFVEDNLNYHWYFCCDDKDRAEFESVDKRTSVTWRGKATRHVPSFPFSRRSHNNPRYCALFRIRNRGMNYVDDYIRQYGAKDYRGWYEGKTCGHGFDFYLPRNMKLRIIQTIPKSVQARGNMWEQHPEYFSLDENGKRSNKMQLCFSNPEARKALTESVRLWIAAHGAGTYMVGVNDEYGGRLCFCEGCKALEKKYACMGGPLWDYMLELCEAVKGQKDVFVTSLAYRYQTQMPPIGVRFPDNFVPDTALAQWDRAPREIPPRKLPDGRIYDFYETLCEWSRIAGNVTYWYYGSPGADYTWGRMGKEIADLHDAGVKGVGYCGLEGGYEFRDIVGYLRLRCLYDVSIDLREEFLKVARVKYGPAADEILAYTELLEKIRVREVRRTPVGAFALDLYQFASERELLEMERLFDRAFAKVAGTPYERATKWARMTLDARASLRGEQLKGVEPAFDAEACETRARAAIADFKTTKLFRKGETDNLSGLLDVMANYKFLKSDELPKELQKYPREKVHRVLPPKEGPYCPFGAPERGGKLRASEPDPTAICGFAITTPVLPDWEKCRGFDDINIGLYGHNVRKHHIPHAGNRPPKSAWKRDGYTLFRLGVGTLSDDPWLLFVGGGRALGAVPVNSRLLGRFFDPVNVDRKYEIWLSLKMEGPIFWPGDTRENKIFIEQMFVVDLD